MDCGFTARTGMWPAGGREMAERSAAVTHNHPEGIKGALAVTDAIFMARFYFGGYHMDYDSPIDRDPAEYGAEISHAARFGFFEYHSGAFKVFPRAADEFERI